MSLDFILYCTYFSLQVFALMSHVFVFAFFVSNLIAF